MENPLCGKQLSPTFTRRSRLRSLSVVAALIASQFSVGAVTETRSGWVEDGAGADYWFEYTETRGKDFGDPGRIFFLQRNCKDTAVPWSYDLTVTHAVVMQAGWSSLSNIDRTVPRSVQDTLKDSGMLPAHSELFSAYRWFGDYLDSGRVQRWNEDRTVMVSETILAPGYWNYSVQVTSLQRPAKCPESGSTAGLLLMGAAICGGGNLLRRRVTSRAESA